MSIHAFTSGATSAGQISAFSRVGNVSGTNSSASTGSARGTRPERPADGGAFIDAIASALSSIGVTAASASATGASASSSDSTASDTSTDTSTSTDPAQALGAFLHTLMSSLREQSGGTQGAQGDKPSGPPPVDGADGGGKRGAPGDIESDLQSLIQSLSSGSASATSSSDGASKLEQSFSNLLSALGVSSDSNGSAADSSKLGQFLQALSSNLSGSMSSGNLINTSA